VSIFFDLFNPNNRHRTEELRRLENTREDESPGAPGRGPIDLNSGTVLIRVPEKDDATSEDVDPEGTDPEDAGPDENEPEDGDAAAPHAEDGGA